MCESGSLVSYLNSKHLEHLKDRYKIDKEISVKKIDKEISEKLKHKRIQEIKENKRKQRKDYL